MNAAHAPAPHAGQPGHAARAPDDIDPPPDPAPHPPRGFRLPAGAVDTHAHVIGREYIAGRSYTPRPAPAFDYLRMLDATGMQYGVLVQVSVHGSDNTLMLQALREQPGRLRGIAVAPHDLAHAEWETLAAAGVVGLRLNTTTGGGVGVAALAEYEAVCLEFGWHLQFLVESRRLPELAPGISRLRVPAVFDHMGYVHAGQGRGAEGHTLRALVRDGAWVKLSGAFRNSEAGPPYDDTLEFTAALAEAGPQRCVWGSDWPHVSFRGRMPNPGDLLDVLGRAVPDAQRRDAILATNAQRLYGFTPPAA